VREAREAGGTVKGITRRHGVSEQSPYRWKAKYGGREVSEARRLKALGAENAKLKKLLAEAHLDNTALKAAQPGAKRDCPESGEAECPTIEVDIMDAPQALRGMPWRACRCHRRHENHDGIPRKKRRQTVQRLVFASILSHGVVLPPGFAALRDYWLKESDT
jgi:putative transposase